MFTPQYLHILLLIVLVEMTMPERDRRVITTLKYSKYRVIPTIVNGEPVERGRLPFLVSIKDPFRTTYSHKLVWVNLCGGSIISPRRILTAAHCFEDRGFFYAKRPSLLRIVAGSILTNIFEWENKTHDPNEQWRTPTKIKVHNNFHFPSNDIALVFIDEPWAYSDKVSYVRTARRNLDYPNYCLTAGYGRVGHGPSDKTSAILLLARVGMMTRRQCTSLWEMSMDSFICTHSAVSDVSEGDSGSPLTCEKTVDPEDKGDYGVLVGLVSGKNFDKTTLFTRVSAFHGWIDRNVAQSLQCNIIYCYVISLLSFL